MKIVQLEAGINQYITTLAVLLGMYPQDIRPVLESSGTLPDYMEPIGVGMPVDLLLRRPDVRSAELSVNAQAALLGASKADWLFGAVNLYFHWFPYGSILHSIRWKEKSYCVLSKDWEESGEVFQQILPVDDHWWKSFQDTKLDSLIALAVDRNYSVAMAINRIAAARANLWIERSNFFPSIGSIC